VARQVVEALGEGREEVLVDALSRQVKEALSGDLRLLYPEAAATR
jgi:hypothetical protein